MAFVSGLSSRELRKGTQGSQVVAHPGSDYREGLLGFSKVSAALAFKPRPALFGGKDP